MVSLRDSGDLSGYPRKEGIGSKNKISGKWSYVKGVFTIKVGGNSKKFKVEKVTDDYLIIRKILGSGNLSKHSQKWIKHFKKS